VCFSAEQSLDVQERQTTTTVKKKERAFERVCRKKRVPSIQKSLNQTCCINFLLREGRWHIFFCA